MGKIMTMTIDEEAAERAEAMLAAGDIESMAAIFEAGLAALEQAAMDEAGGDPFDFDDPAQIARLKGLVDEALHDSRPPIPMEEAFAQVREAIRDRHRA